MAEGDGREAEFAANRVVLAQSVEMNLAIGGVRAEAGIIGHDVIDLMHDLPQDRFFR